jgi:OHCU decarboxylase
MSSPLERWNTASHDAAVAALRHCCASQRWADAVASMRPFADEPSLFAAADEVWSRMSEPDWLEAFRAHPRIGDRKPAHATAQSTAWSQQEQSGVSSSASQTQQSLAAGNEAYERLFGFTYIVCATGKSAEEMLAILTRRLQSDRPTELREAAEQQRQITQIRLRKWLNP